MSDAETLSAARSDYKAGRINREEFWRLSSECYLRLRERTPLDPAGPVTAIHRDGDQLFVELRDGLRMWWDPTDVRTAPNILLNHGTYERAELTVLETLADSAATVLDIGANVGWYTLHLASRVGPRGGHVYAFEPVPATHDMLVRNVLLNNMGGIVTVSPVGLADAAGDATFFVPARTGSVAASQRQLFADESNTRITVRLERLDDALPRLRAPGPDLIKCDIEGGELLMLRGGLTTLREHHPMIFLELLRKWSRAFDYHPNDVIALLRAEGYACHAIAEAGLEPLTEMSDDCPYTNFLFLREEHAEAHGRVRARLRDL